ncbi:MAG: outer membrane protein assembly factor BamD, partial [Synergistales bacterium]|nr:outer membrane protein assembly factor BamD [Synergistales bacterium]
MKISKLFVLISIGLLPHSFALADWVWSPEQGKFINTESETQSGAEDLFDNALDLYKEKKLDKAAEQFQLLLKQYPRSRVAPEAQYRLGTLYEEKSDYVQAHKTYQALIKSYPQSERFEEVVEREYQIGNMFLSGKKGKLMGLEIRPSLPLAIEV